MSTIGLGRAFFRYDFLWFCGACLSPVPFMLTRGFALKCCRRRRFPLDTHYVRCSLTLGIFLFLSCLIASWLSARFPLKSALRSQIGSRFSAVLTAVYEGRSLTTDIEFDVVNLWQARTGLLLGDRLIVRIFLWQKMSNVCGWTKLIVSALCFVRIFVVSDECLSMCVVQQCRREPRLLYLSLPCVEEFLAVRPRMGQFCQILVHVHSSLLKEVGLIWRARQGMELLSLRVLSQSLLFMIFFSVHISQGFVLMSLRMIMPYYVNSAPFMAWFACNHLMCVLYASHC
jgi:hypothetical protein